MSDDRASPGTGQEDSEDRHNPPRTGRVSFLVDEDQKSLEESKELVPDYDNNDNDNSDDEYAYNPPSVPASAQAEEKHQDEQSCRRPSSRRPSLRRLSNRRDHLQVLVRQKRASQIFIQQDLLLEDIPEEFNTESIRDVLSDSQKETIRKQCKGLPAGNKYLNEIRQHFPQNDNHVEIRLKDFNYRVSVDPNHNKIRTLYNQSMTYTAWTFIKRLFRGEPRKKKHTTCVLQNVTLNFEPGKMYLVLGPPQSGKTTLLKAVAGRLSTTNGERTEGSILYNGLSLKDKRDLYVENVISFVGQLDFHAPRLTVQETFEFAFNCKSGGTHVPAEVIMSDECRQLVQKFDEENYRINVSMQILGLSGVADTFVGNSEIRGVSGGQRRRVTTGEMSQASITPVMCMDEISTGLDAASTFDIISIIAQTTRLDRATRIISLLQPSPETVSLFDEVILLGEGHVIYAGPVTMVEDYFASLGYRACDQCDVADFLQVLSTPDGANLYIGDDSPYTMEGFAQAFRDSEEFQDIQDRQTMPWETEWNMTKSEDLPITTTTAVLKKKYRNSGMRSTWLNLRRNLVIWKRDKRFLIANAIKNVIMGVSVGGVFFQTDNVVSIYGVLFQLNLFIMLGAMTSVPEQVNDRIIYYRHADDNFYGAFAYTFGKGISLLPQSLIDILIFGTICYFMVGLEVAASNYFIFIALLFVFSVVMNQQISIFTAICQTKGSVQAASSGILLFNLVFSGFIVPPSVIPAYYHWLFWWVPMSWTYRGLLVNEFLSPSYNVIEGDTSTTLTEGELALYAGGMVHNGEPFGTEWIGYAFAYQVPYLLLCTFVTGACLKYVRVEPKSSPTVPAESAIANQDKKKTEAVPDAEAVVDAGDVEGGESPVLNHDTEQTEAVSDVEAGVDEGDVEANVDDGEISIPFIPVTLTFSDICYDVRASKGNETIRLLNNVYGMFEAGRMCALMGSSGAGKTTLMDVIALRKTSGTITGDIRLNGFKQERISFRRCSGYVEQFDVQQAELTVRETVLFSARLRLNSQDPSVAGDELKQRFVDHVLETLELTSLSKSIMGTQGEGGLSFEQRKRVSIAVELAASPSVIFLDEPTSGLDARAALLVVKALRKISDQGRTVVATIHQPSSAVFEMFDDLFLLKKGGRTVFAGELGGESHKLVEYFEARGASEIDRGENPANWMLTAITSETIGTDFAEEFAASSEFETLKMKIQKNIDDRNPNLRIKFEEKFAAPGKERRTLVNERIRTVYWRSPAYNLARMLISLLIAFILGSIFVTNRKPVEFSEQGITAIINTIFISFIIVGVMCINSVIPVMLALRDNFYRQRAAGMTDHVTLSIALGVAEKWFIVISSILFCLVFLSMLGITSSPRGSFGFWGFFCFNTAIYSYFGQAFIACVPTAPTAQILAAVFIGLNNFFSGLIVRPQYLSGFFEIPYWITPGHYVFEGMTMSVFHDDQTPVIATPGSIFYEATCPQQNLAPGVECTGPVSAFVDVFFGGKFQFEHIWYDALILGVYLLLARVVTYYGLMKFNYMNT